MIIGSRGSALALWQARWIQARLPGSEILVIKTTGDQIAGPAVPAGKGVFTKEIEEALLDRRIDVAVHSLKDLPTEIDPRLTLAAVPAREEVRDALVGRTLASLPRQARVGTGSPAQRYGFKRGDVVLSVNGEKIGKSRDLERLTNDGGRVWRITIVRAGQQLSVVLGG